MSAMTTAAIRWLTGSPLWREAAGAVAEGADDSAMARPALLRFSSDAFMDELAGVLAAEPEGIREWVARPAAFREPPPGAPPDWEPAADRLRLFLPVHGHFNLVVASLVCRRPGMPDHTVKMTEDEHVVFVLRRIRPVPGADPAVVCEQAWLPRPPAPDGPSGWVDLPLGGERTLAEGEETHGLFPVPFELSGVARRLHAGLIPTTSVQSAVATGAAGLDAALVSPDEPPAANSVPDQDPRWEQLDRTVVIPLAVMRDVAVMPHPTDDDLAEPSAFVLLDLAHLLSREAPEVWQAIETGVPPATGTSGRALYEALDASADTAGSLNWRQALLRAWTERSVLAGEVAGPTGLRVNLRRSALSPRLADPHSLTGDAPGTGSLQGLVRAVLPPPEPAGPATATPSGAGPATAMPKYEPMGRALYRVRCVYVRPRCAPWPTALVSDPSEDFGISSYFDPDAPARDIRIALPIDTSVRDLRKFRKNVGFLISNQLRSQMSRVSDLKKAMDGEIGEEQEWEFGLVCQMSIPIITICALMVLMIFLVLLNIVFFWLPFFRICLPVPLRSKK
ncbi:hypothetical protein [Streptomyces sp. NPDC059916]|uniref:hypothetical protein n=1 Tax=Streptomyces sp. NPDC059916 TaxID=3347001 RepID=UPI0036CDB142